MTAIYPANIQEFFTFIPERPRLHPTASIAAKAASFIAQYIPLPEDQPISWSLDSTLIPRLKEFLASVDDNINVGDVSCQSMEEILLCMSVLSLKAENTVSLYGEYINTAINPIARTITNAAHLSGNTVVERSLGSNSTNSQKDEYNFKGHSSNKRGGTGSIREHSSLFRQGRGIFGIAFRGRAAGSTVPSRYD